MKNIYHFAALALALSLGLFATPSSSKACLNSSMSLVSIVPSGTDTTVTMQICIAGGFGGASGDTRSFSVYFYNGQSNPVQSGLTVASFSPSSVTGQVTGCQMDGVDIGPTATPFQTLDCISYLDPGYYGTQPCASTPFACTSSLANCGAPYVQCITFSATMNFVPDFACVYGLENLTCDCNTMGIALRNGVPTANWAAPRLSLSNQGIQINWDAASDALTNGRYEVLRAFGGQAFASIASIEAATTGQQPLSYLDAEQALHGAVLYKIRYFSPDGQMAESPMASLQLPEFHQLGFVSLHPNPSQGQMTAELFLPTEGLLEWQLLDVMGKLVAKNELPSGAGLQVLDLDFGQIPAGTYFLQLMQEGQVASRKVLIQ
jgi:hypothetical protein